MKTRGYIWRDLLDIGLNDGQETTLDYPFLNGANYIYTNKHIFIRRQDPDTEIITLFDKEQTVTPIIVC